MIDSMIATTDKILAKHYKKPLFLDGAVQRLDAWHCALSRCTQDERGKITSDLYALLSCYVPDSVWDYCLQEAMKPLEVK